jgi:uncharacterized protein
MKTLYTIFFISSLLFTGVLHAQQKKTPVKSVKSVAIPIADLPRNAKSKLFATGRATKDEILIRWAPADENTWSLCNKYGYVIEKYTIVKNGKVLDKFIPSQPKMNVAPKPLEEWDSLVNNDDYAAVMAQAMYGEDFEVDVNGAANSGLTSIINQTAMNKQRYTMSMYAADHSFKAAQFGALAYKDKLVKSDEKYFYRIYAKAPPALRKIDTAFIFIGLSDYKPLPKPSDIIAEFGDKTVLLKWDYETLKESYTSYIVERSADGGKTFRALSDKPFTNLTENKNTDIPAGIFYMDSLLNNDTVYQYRIAGISLFGDTGPYSNIISGKGKFFLAFTPALTGVNHLDNGDYYLNWEMDDSLNRYIREFKINHAEKEEGPYKTVIQKISPSTRTIKVDSLTPSNYFTVSAVSLDGDVKTSAPFLIQSEDSIPPAIPANFAAIIDTNGVVSLSWKPNTEKDLAGYRIFKANLSGHEMIPLFDSVWKGTSFTDTTNLKSLNSKVYYTVKAVDFRANESPYAPVAEVKKPDVIPPTQPVLTGYEIVEKGIKILWINSADEDVVAHIVYRKRAESIDGNWELLSTVKDKRIQEFIDETCEGGKTYSYTMIAVDSAKLESPPQLPLTVVFPEKRVKTAIKKLNTVVDRDARTITIAWEKMPDIKNIKQFELYRGTEKQAISLYKQFDNTAAEFIDKDLEVNTKYKYAVRAIYNDGKFSDFITKTVIY